MSVRNKALIVAAIQCAIALSLTGKLLYDRATQPRVWVKTRPRDPSLPIRGRYLALQLTPMPGDPFFEQTDQSAVLYFVPERTTDLEKLRASRRDVEVWAEVTIPKSGPPRPIRLGTRIAGGQITPAEIN